MFLSVLEAIYSSTYFIILADILFSRKHYLMDVHIRMILRILRFLIFDFSFVDK